MDEPASFQVAESVAEAAQRLGIEKALKLYAGGRQDLADIGELLVKNRDANLDEIRLASNPYDRGGDLERLIAEASLRLRSVER